jgi:uncharacterized protein
VTANTAAPTQVVRRPSTWTVAGLLVGIPLSYWIKDALTPWGDRLFDQHDRQAFYGFWMSVVALHWLSVVVCLAVLRRDGIGLHHLGVPDRRRAIRTVALPAVVGVVFVIVRSLLGPITILGGDVFFGIASPADVPQRLVWVVVGITAGVCEELVYRGVALTLLRRRGFSTAAAVAMATIPFALMHGPAGIFGFPILGALAVGMSILYLRTRSLAPGMATHALIVLGAMLTAR